jgi:hypothetical protein
MVNKHRLTGLYPLYDCFSHLHIGAHILEVEYVSSKSDTKNQGVKRRQIKDTNRLPCPQDIALSNVRNLSICYRHWGLTFLVDIDRNSHA